MKPLDTVVYWLDNADASEAFCGKVVLFSIGQYSNSTLFAFIWHCHVEHLGNEYGIGVIVPFHSRVLSMLANRLAK